MFSSCLQDNGPWGGPCSPCPIHVSLPVGLGQMEGPPACVMLDALLLAGPIFVSDCLFPESQMLSPDLNSAQVLRGHGEELADDPWAWGCCCTQHPSPGHQGCPAGSLASCKSDFSPPGTNRVRFFSTTIPITSLFHCNKCLCSNFPTSPLILQGRGEAATNCLKCGNPARGN